MPYPLDQVTQAIDLLTDRMRRVPCAVCGAVGSWRHTGVEQATPIMDAAQIPPLGNGGHPTGYVVFVCTCSHVCTFDPRVVIARDLSESDSPS